MQKYADTALTIYNGALVPLGTATVTVRHHGSQTLANIYAVDDPPASKANPFLTSATGAFEFYAADGVYDVTVEKVGYQTVNLIDVLLEDPQDSSGQLANTSINSSSFNNGIITASLLSQTSYVNFDTTFAGYVPTTPGTMVWNPDERTVDLRLVEGGPNLQIGQETVYRVRNQSGVAIPNGAVVAAAGTTGNSGRILVSLADMASIPGEYVMGIATEAIDNNADGFVTHFGKVRSIDTTGSAVGETWADGDVLYAHPSQVGKLTKVQPLGRAVQVAIVLHAANNGTLMVRPNVLHTSHGTYTPTVTAVSNVMSITQPTFNYVVVNGGLGAVVTVFGSLTLTHASASFPTVVRFSLPIASNFDGNPEAVGGAGVIAATYSPVAVYEDISNDQICLDYLAVGSAQSRTIRFSATYRVK